MNEYVAALAGRRGAIMCAVTWMQVVAIIGIVVIVPWGLATTL